MRTVLTTGGILTFVGSAEWAFLEKHFSDSAQPCKKDFNEQENEMARNLTSRGVLQRFKNKKNKICYTKNQNKGV